MVLQISVVSSERCRLCTCTPKKKRTTAITTAHQRLREPQYAFVGRFAMEIESNTPLDESKTVDSLGMCCAKGRVLLLKIAKKMWLCLCVLCVCGTVLYMFFFPFRSLLPFFPNRESECRENWPVIHFIETTTSEFVLHSRTTRNKRCENKTENFNEKFSVIFFSLFLLFVWLFCF